MHNIIVFAFKTIPRPKYTWCVCVCVSERLSSFCKSDTGTFSRHNQYLSCYLIRPFFIVFWWMMRGEFVFGANRCVTLWNCLHPNWAAIMCLSISLSFYLCLCVCVCMFVCGFQYAHSISGLCLSTRCVLSDCGVTRTTFRQCIVHVAPHETTYEIPQV